MMASSNLGIIQFINTSHQGNVVSAEEQWRANSHAARIAHAKARRLRTIEYQARKAIQAPMGSQEVEDLITIAASGVVPPILDGTVDTEQSIFHSPVSILASDRKDPFESFGRPFKPVEHFLLDHCKSFHRLHLYYYEVTPLLLTYLTQSRRKGCNSTYGQKVQQAC